MRTTYESIEQSSERRDGCFEQHTRLQGAVVLLCLALFTTGSHYAKHSLSGLGPEIMKSLNVDRLEFGVLFSFQQVPGIVLPVLGGLLLSYVPLAPAAVTLALILLLSSVICALAIDMTSYNMLLLGRFVFGLGDGLLTTVQGSIIARRFRHGNVSTAFGAMLFASRTSSFVGFALPPVVLSKYSLSGAMWVTALIMGIPVCTTIAYAWISVHLPVYHPVSADGREDDERMRGSIFTAIRSLKIPFWIIAYTFMTVASTTFSFLHFASDVFGETIGMTPTLSALLSGLLFLCAGLASPLVGVLEDRHGKRSQLLITSCVSTTIGILVCCLLIPFPGLGARAALVGLLFLAFSLCVAPVALLSCVAILVPSPVLPLALGAYKSTENAGMAVVHVVVGGLRDLSSSYFLSLLFLALLAVSSVLPLFYLWRVSPVLDLPAKQINDEDRILSET